MSPLAQHFQAFLSGSTNGLAAWLLISVVLFFLVREILMWYWKINKIVSLLEEIRDNTQNSASSGGTKIEEAKAFISSDQLTQPFGTRIALTSFAALLLIGGTVLVFQKETVWGVISFLGGIIILAPMIILDRKKRMSLSETTEESL